MHLWKSGRIGSLEVKGDCILGHEAAGIVLKCGEGVTSLRPGESVSGPRADHTYSGITLTAPQATEWASSLRNHANNAFSAGRAAIISVTT